MLTGLALQILLLFDVVLDLIPDQLLVTWIEAEVEGDPDIGLLG